jgi:hypothetical protein
VRLVCVCCVSLVCVGQLEYFSILFQAPGLFPSSFNIMIHNCVFEKIKIKIKGKT